MSRVLLIGGTGTISAHTLAALTGAGHEAVVLTRGDHGAPGGNGVGRIEADRRDEAALAAAVVASRPDVIIDFACFRPDEARAIARIANGRVRQLIFVSTVDVFGFPQPVLPIPEDAAITAPNSPYAAAKQQCEAILRAASDPARLPVTVVRPTYSLGPRFVISLFEHAATRVLARMRHGRPVLVPGDGRRLIHASDAADTGRMIAALAGRAESFGRTFTVGSRDGTLTQADYYRHLGEAVGRAPDLVFVDDAVLEAETRGPVADGLYRTLTRFHLSFAIGGHRAVAGFAAAGRIDDGIAAYVARIEAEGALAVAPPRDFEDALAERH